MKGIRILLVDDNPSARALLAAFVNNTPRPGAVRRGGGRLAGAGTDRPPAGPTWCCWTSSCPAWTALGFWRAWAACPAGEAPRDHPLRRERRRLRAAQLPPGGGLLPGQNRWTCTSWPGASAPCFPTGSTRRTAAPPTSCCCGWGRTAAWRATASSPTPWSWCRAAAGPCG